MTPAFIVRPYPTRLDRARWRDALAADAFGTPSILRRAGLIPGSARGR